LPYKRHCTECCGEAQDCSIRKACRDCKQNCGTKDIALKVRTLRVDCSIRNLTGTARRIALQMTLSECCGGNSESNAASEKPTRTARRISLQKTLW